MAYYDRIATSWHRATGYRGGSFKKYVLNDILIEKMAAVAGRSKKMAAVADRSKKMASVAGPSKKMAAVAGQSILELGAGNGYFMPLALERYSGQVPERLVITDGSSRLLAIAETHFKIPGAQYLQLDVRSPFPFEDAGFDLILATMIFNEVSTGGLRRALLECRRVLRPTGLLLATITHPAFINSLDRRKQLKKAQSRTLTMPGPGHLRLPIVPRRLSDYERLLTKPGCAWEQDDVYMTAKVLGEKPGLSPVAGKPLALIFSCRPL